MDANARRARKQKLTDESTKARQAALKQALGKIPRTVDVSVVEETYNPNESAAVSTETGPSRAGGASKRSQTDEPAPEPQGQKRPRVEKAKNAAGTDKGPARSDKRPSDQSSARIEIAAPLEAVVEEIPGETRSSPLGALPRGYKGKEAVWLDANFVQGLDMPKARQIREAIADVIPLGPLSWDSPPGVQMEIGRGITARVVVQDDAPAKDEVAELKDLSGQFGIAASMLGTRINKAIEAAEKRKAELKKTNAALGASDKAKVALESKSAEALAELDRVKRALVESTKLDAELKEKVAVLKSEARQSAEGLAAAQEEITRLKEQLAGANKAVEEATQSAEEAKKVAEKAGSEAIAAYKLSDEFADYQEASFDQGFNHLARCLWAYHGKESITFEEMLRWVNMSQSNPELLAIHPDIPYAADHIVAMQATQIEEGEQVWDPPPVNPLNFAVLKDPPVPEHNLPGDEFIDTPPGST